MERLKELRLKFGLTQKQLAEILGVDRTAVVKYETNRNGPSSETLEQLADYFGVTVDYLLGRDTSSEAVSSSTNGIKIPVLGDVAAGIPIEAITDIIDYEEIPESMALAGEYFGLRVKGRSMEPQMVEGDVVIVRRQDDVESGEIAVVLVNGESATVKRIKKRDDGIVLIPFNPMFEPIYYSNSDIAALPVTIVGKVAELRRKF